MKSNKRIIVPKPQIKLQNIIQRLLKEPISYYEFLELLEKCSDSLYENPELEFELLVSNGLPLDFHGDFICLKTSNTLIKDQIFCIVDIETSENLKELDGYGFYGVDVSSGVESEIKGKKDKQKMMSCVKEANEIK